MEQHFFGIKDTHFIVKSSQYKIITIIIRNANDINFI